LLFFFSFFCKLLSFDSLDSLDSFALDLVEKDSAKLANLDVGLYNLPLSLASSSANLNENIKKNGYITA
jgi:hypothetical protein